MKIRGTFSDSIDLAVINAYDKGAVMQISTVFGHVDSAVINEFDERDVMQISTVFEDVYDVACRRVFSSGTF